MLGTWRRSISAERTQRLPGERPGLLISEPRVEDFEPGESPCCLAVRVHPIASGDLNLDCAQKQLCGCGDVVLGSSFPRFVHRWVDQMTTSLRTSLLAGIAVVALAGPSYAQSGGGGGGGSSGGGASSGTTGGSAAGSGGATRGSASPTTGTGTSTTGRGTTSGTATPNPALNSNPAASGQTAIPTPDPGSGQSATPGSATSKGDGNTPQTGAPGTRASNRGNFPDPSPNTQTQANSPIDRSATQQPSSTSGGMSRREGARGSDMKSCMETWDKGTHITKARWREICSRTLGAASR